ncbi:hypothetical protein [Streptomyces sp. NPDC097619]|uniref:hypothetical protein n=1 Tax=Streptomyces sp. NPDC097619 TaxID=3157228 RepID=UPI00332AEAE5
MTVLTVSVDPELAGRVEEQARRSGLQVDAYVVAVLRAAQGPEGADREALALELARGAYRRWESEGRSEDGAMTMDEVFGR